MRTYQNLAAIRENEGRLKKFVFDVIGEHKDSTAYKVASVAEKYYASWTTANVNNKLTAVVKDSIQNVDIYNGLFDI